MDDNETNSDTDPEYVPDEPDKEEEDPQEHETEERKGQSIWTHFIKVPPASEKRARCSLCFQIKSFKTTTTNLKMHLKYKHPTAMKALVGPKTTSGDRNSADVDATETDFDSSMSKIKRRHRVATVWKYFQKLSPKSEGMARCKLCLQVRSYRTSITNLKNHLSFKHPAAVEQDQQLMRRIVSGSNLSETEAIGSDDDMSADQVVKNYKPAKRIRSNGRSTVWRHFEKLKPFHEGMARCKYCHNTRSYRTSISNLKVHLSMKHAEKVEHDEEFVYKSYLFKQRRSPQVRLDYLQTATENDDHNDTNDSDSEKSTKQNRKPRRVKKTDVSKLFTLDRGSDGDVAVCSLCHKGVRFTTTAALKQHILKVHEEVTQGSSVDEVELNLDEVDSDGNKDRTLEDDPEPSTKKKKLGMRSKNWEYFELVDKWNKIAKCNICGRELSFSTISNLKKHLIRMHSNMGTVAEHAYSSEEPPSKNKRYVPRNYKPRNRFRSSVWKYFDNVEGAAKMATCRLCNKNFSSSCLSNLRKHLKKKHDGEFSSSDEEGEVEILEEQTSPVWAYFKCLSQDLKIASCLICKKRVDYNDNHDLNKHLSRKHPQAQAELDSTKPKKLMITGNGEIYEIDEDVAKQEPVAAQEANDNDSDDWPYNNDETDALDTPEYLDENIFNKPETVPTKKRRILHNKLQHTPKQCEESSLDIFGKYMVSLLKKLPKYKSDQLQADFVRQIMEAQNDNQYTCIQNTRSVSSTQNTHTQNTRISIDDRVTCNSEAQRVITGDEVSWPPNLNLKVERAASSYLQSNEAGNVKFSSEILRHFDVEEDEAICGLCRDSIPSGLEDMRKHLEETHSNVLDDITQKVLDAASEEDHLLGDDDVYTEVVYLEDEPKKTNERPEQPKRKLKSQPKISKFKTERHSSTSSEEVVQKTKQKRFHYETEKDPEELDLFVNYITVLLKKVPKESSQKLHLDIINLIMNATQPQNKVILETANVIAKVSEVERSIVLQNDTNTSDTNTNTINRVFTIPVQCLPQNDKTNTISHVVVTNSSGINISDARENTVTEDSLSMPEIRVFSNTNTR